MLLLLAGLAHAATPPEHVHGPAADATSAWQGFVEHVETGGARGQCLTGLALDLREHWEELSAEQQARVAEAMPLVAPGSLKELERPAGVPLMPATDTCWGPYAENRIVGEHFTVEWDTGAIDSATAQDFLDALEHSWTKEFDEQGWDPPDGTNSYLLMAYVTNDYSGGAYTTVYRCGGVYMPYIVAASDSFGWGTWYQDMAAHELNHASQFGYAFSHEFWFWEATATYIEEDVYPTHNAWSSYIQGYSEFPWLAMNYDERGGYEGYHMYGMAIWLFYVDEYWHGDMFAQDAWEYSKSNGYQYDIAMADLIEDFGYDFEEVYDGFIAANTVMAYREQRSFPEVKLSDEIHDLPADGGDDGVGALGQNYILIDAGLGTDETPDLEVTLDGEADGDWTALLVGTFDGAVDEVVKFELTDDEGTAKLTEISRFDDVYLVVSPRQESSSGWYYDWEARLVEPPAPPPEEEAPAIDPHDSPEADGGLLGFSGACGCNGASGSGIGWLWAAGGLLALRRRR